MSPAVSIIDDDPWAREGITNLVASLGYRTRSFASAQHFLDSTDISDTQCLILDVQMPGLTGLDLQELLLSQGHKIAVIMMTAYPEIRIRKRALDAGASEFLVKPLDEARLVLSLLKAVGPAH
jgi:FixJ family two-component response regulator